MPIPDISPIQDHIGDTSSAIKNNLRKVCEAIAGGLDESIRALKNNSTHTEAEFFSDPRVGTNGGQYLSALGYWRAILQANAPDLITEAIRTAGAGLSVNTDGSVTVV